MTAGWLVIKATNHARHFFILRGFRSTSGYLGSFRCLAIIQRFILWRVSDKKLLSVCWKYDYAILCNSKKKTSNINISLQQWLYVLVVGAYLGGGGLLIISSTRMRLTQWGTIRGISVFQLQIGSHCLRHCGQPGLDPALIIYIVYNILYILTNKEIKPRHHQHDLRWYLKVWHSTIKSHLSCIVDAKISVSWYTYFVQYCVFYNLPSTMLWLVSIKKSCYWYWQPHIISSYKKKIKNTSHLKIIDAFMIRP